MNEATFEGYLDRALDRIFVGPVRPKIQHQKTLILKLGHHDVNVDGLLKAEVRGRLDVLLLLDEIPLAVLELKRPELALTEDDEDQAWSYARLQHPMPPFYIVTNGEETRIFRTYDRSRVDGKTLDEQAIINQISSAAEAAAEGERVAIHCLLGKSPEVFRSIFQRISYRQLQFVVGAVDDIARPVCNDFGIVRDATFALYQALAVKGITVVTLFGEALSGKTNVAADLVHMSYFGPVDPAIAPVYMNCEYLETGFLQTLANEVSMETNVPATVDDVRHWLRSHTLTITGAKPVILVDSWSPDLTERLGAELSELLDLASSESFSVVVVVDSAHSDQVLTTTRRAQPSKLANMSVTVRVPRTMSDREVMVAAHLLYERRHLELEHGAQHNMMYRLPSTWRMLAAYKGREDGVLPATLGAEQLHNILINYNLSAEQLDDWHRYCAVVLDDQTPSLHGLLISSPGLVGMPFAKDALGEKRLRRLISHGFVRVRKTHDGRPVVTTQVPPLLAATAVSVVQERLKEALNNQPLKEAVDTFLANCQRLPYCELVGAMAILGDGLSQERSDAVFSQLMEMEPTINEIPADAKLAILIEGQDPIELPADLVRLSIEEGGKFSYGNVLPYVIISHVMRWAVVNNGKVPDGTMRAIERVASVRLPLYATDFSSKERLRYASPITSFELRGGGTVLSACNGVIEPITDALRHVALNATKDFASLVDRLLNEVRPNFPLLNRTYLVAQAVSYLQTPVAKEARAWTKALGKLIETRCSEELVHTEVSAGE